MTQQHFYGFDEQKNRARNAPVELATKTTVEMDDIVEMRA